jgi:type II secretory pathway component PulF
MATFRYKALGADGKVLSGEMEAADARSVISQLRTAGHVPVKAEPKAEWLDIGRFGRNLRFLRQC